MKLKTKAKLIVGGLILILFGVFVFLNRTPVTVDLIVAEVEMSQAVLVLGVFIAGLLLGWILHSVFRVKNPLSKG